MQAAASCKCIWGAFFRRLALPYFPIDRSCWARLEGWRWLFKTSLLTVKKQSVPSLTVLVVRSRSDSNLADFTQDGPGSAWAGRFQEVWKFDQGMKKLCWTRQGSAFEFCSGFLTNWGATPLSVYFSTFCLGVLYACKPIWGCVGLYSKLLKLLSKYEWGVTNFKCNKHVRDRRVAVTLGILTLQWLENHVLSMLPLQQKWEESWVSGEKELLHSNIQCLSDQYSYKQN